MAYEPTPEEVSDLVWQLYAALNRPVPLSRDPYNLQEILIKQARKQLIEKAEATAKLTETQINAETSCHA